MIATSATHSRNDISVSNELLTAICRLLKQGAASDSEVFQNPVLDTKITCQYPKIAEI
ncbi:MAG: hypothetical protein IKZ88_01990 [Neisseriaceae bacterium]|nr:hypothetical protein [Neisseriaceae bacterium]